MTPSTNEEIRRAMTASEDLSQKIKEITETKIMEEELRLLQKYATLTERQEKQARGAEVRIYKYDHRGDTFQAILVNGICVAVSALKEEPR